jgi:Zn-dependent protease
VTESPEIATSERRRCECGTELSPALLVCPSCRRLVHREQLERLAERARTAEAAGDAPTALVAWREALDLLPADSSQARVISERVAATRDSAPKATLEAAAKVDSSGKPGSRLARLLAPLGFAGVLLWKFKFILVAVLGKAKLALLGLTKLGTLTSMLASFGIYWAAWGWPLAAGLVLSIYLHEMGHIAQLAKLGLKVEPPMFIPGFGAFIRMKQRPLDAIEEARIGLAGPIWGLGAALLALLAWRMTGAGILLAICHLGAWINLFNLLPLGPLDGGRGFRALAKSGRWAIACAFLIAYLVTSEGLLLLLLAVAIFRSFRADVERNDPRALFEFLGLIAAFAALLLLPSPLPGAP